MAMHDHCKDSISDLHFVEVGGCAVMIAEAVSSIRLNNCCVTPHFASIHRSGTKDLQNCLVQL